MPDMDQGIKRLIQTHPSDVLALTLPVADYLGTLPVDVAAEPQLALDTLLRVRYQGIECAVDLAAEARPRPDIGRQLFEYGARASIVTGLPVISVVLWLERDGIPPASPYELRAGDLLLATWRFIAVAMYNLPAEHLIQHGLVGLLPLVAFTRDAGDFDVIERAAAIVKARAADDEVVELEEPLAVFATRGHGAGPALALFRRLIMSQEILESSPLYQLWYREATEKAAARAAAQAELQATRNATRIALQGRFGELPPTLAEAIASADLAALQRVLAHVGTDTLEQMRQRLGA